MSQIKSNVRQVIQFAVVVEEIDGQTLLSSFIGGQPASSGALAAMFAPALPVVVEQPALPAPVVNKPTPAPVVNKPVVKETEEDEFARLMKIAKERKIKGAHLIKKLATLKEKLAATESNAPQTTPTSKPQGDNKPQGGQGGGFKKPMKKERHPLATASKAIILTKSQKEIEVFIVEEIKTPNFTGFKVCRPDEDGIDDKWIYGAVWAIPTTALVRWVD